MYWGGGSGGAGIPKATLGFSDWLERQSSDQLFVMRVAEGYYSYRGRIESAQVQGPGRSQQGPGARPRWLPGVMGTIGSPRSDVFTKAKSCCPGSYRGWARWAWVPTWVPTWLVLATWQPLRGPCDCMAQGPPCIEGMQPTALCPRPQPNMLTRRMVQGLRSVRSRPVWMCGAWTPGLLSPGFAAQCTGAYLFVVFSENLLFHGFCFVNSC